MAEFTATLFALNLALLATHELDAVRAAEWRLLPGLNRIADPQTAFRTFTLLHVPLFALLFWAADRPAVQVGLDLFLIAHAGAHFALRRHPLYDFNNTPSRLLIFGAVPTAALHLLLLGVGWA